MGWVGEGLSVANEQQKIGVTIVNVGVQVKQNCKMSLYEFFTSLKFISLL